MKKSAYLILFGIAIVFCSASCASIVSKSEYPVAINSNPDKAKITVTNKDGQVVFDGITPTIVTLNAGAGYFSGQDYFIKFEKEGYESHTVQVVRNVDGWYILGNLFFGGLIGWLIVDPATGAMWTLENVHADLHEDTEPAEVKDPSVEKQSNLHFMTIDELPEQLRTNLVRIN